MENEIPILKAPITATKNSLIITILLFLVAWYAGIIGIIRVFINGDYTGMEDAYIAAFIMTVCFQIYLGLLLFNCQDVEIYHDHIQLSQKKYNNLNFNEVKRVNYAKTITFHLNNNTSIKLAPLMLSDKQYKQLKKVLRKTIKTYFLGMQESDN